MIKQLNDFFPLMHSSGKLFLVTEGKKKAPRFVEEVICLLRKYKLCRRLHFLKEKHLYIQEQQVDNKEK